MEKALTYGCCEKVFFNTTDKLQHVPFTKAQRPHLCYVIPFHQAPVLSLDYKTGTIVKKADEKFSLPKEIERLLLEAGDIPEEAELPSAAVDVAKNDKGEMYSTS